MIVANGKTYFQVGDKVTTIKFAGAPAVVVAAKQDIVNGEYYYTLEVDVSNHADGYDENGEKVATMSSFCHESEVSSNEVAPAEVTPVEVVAAEEDFSAQDAADAKYDFYQYAEDTPGVKAKEILASMSGVQNKAYWDAALGRAMEAHAKWCAA